MAPRPALAALLLALPLSCSEVTLTPNSDAQPGAALDGGAGGSPGSDPDRPGAFDGGIYFDVPPPDTGGVPTPPDASAACKLIGKQQHMVLPNETVTSTAGRTYSSNPASSGPHCGTTVRYGAYPTPVDRCYWLANLARGAVVILYNCPDGCPEITGEFARVSRQFRDADCPGANRVLFAPDSSLDSRIAAAAWGATWKADCLDPGAQHSLAAFVNEHLGTAGQAPERDAKRCD